MLIISQIAFAILLAGASILFAANTGRIITSIRRARKLWPTDNADERWTRVFLIALGQKKMFKRPVPAILHLFVYVGFVIINIEVLEITVDGLFGSHRILAPWLGNIYGGFITFFEFLALGVLVSCIIFLIRRNVLKVRRLNARELDGWPRADANIILFAEILMMTAFLSMNAADMQLQSIHASGYHHTGSFLISGFIQPVFSGWSEGALVAVERFGWWFHIIGIFAFLNYLPFSKHLHILFAFPNTFYSKLESPGKMRNMPEITREVQLMLDPNAAMAAGAEPPAEPGRFGAKDVSDLTSVDILGAYSCTECGRCTASCPANITGKLLSPRKIMMDTRDRCEDLAKHHYQSGNWEDGKSLLGDYTTHEEILACTSCQACVEACPVNIDPLSIINQMRRYIIMEEAASPGQWNTMFSNIENNQAPWQFSPADRFKWAEEA